jgi:hypothetical protein
MSYTQSSLMVDMDTQRRNHISCSPANEDICFINVFATELTDELVCKIDFSGLTSWSCEGVSDSGNIAVSGLGATGDDTVVVFQFDQTTSSTVDYNVYLLDFSGPSMTWGMSDGSSGKSTITLNTLI